MQMNAYLSFRGECEAAFKFYEECLDGKLGEIFRYAGTPLADRVPADCQNTERIFHLLAKDGTVVMPLEKTFWAARFGMLVDRFGIPWLINCEGSGQAVEA
jgi:PhnB protein